MIAAAHMPDDSTSSGASTTTLPTTQDEEPVAVAIADSDLRNILVDSQDRTLYLSLKG